MSGEQRAQAESRITTEQELRQLNDEWIKALVRRDALTLQRIMADDFVFTYPLEGDDRAQFINDVVSGDLLVEYLNRDNVTVRIWGDTAILTVRAICTAGGRGAFGVCVLAVISRLGDRAGLNSHQLPGIVAV